MNAFMLLEYAAWFLSAALALWMILDVMKTDNTYTEDLLTSSREADIVEMSDSRHSPKRDA